MTAITTSSLAMAKGITALLPPLPVGAIAFMRLKKIVLRSSV